MANVSLRRHYTRPGLHPPASQADSTRRIYAPARTSKPESPSQRALRRDVSETLQHAALINIVAAVNEDLDGSNVTKSEVSAAPGSAIDSLKNTVAVISNLMTPRHRSVSIPKQQQQKVFTMSDDIVQKKPVYYRQNTCDDSRFTKAPDRTPSDVKVKVDQSSSVTEELTCPSPVQSVRIMPVRTKYNDSDFKILEANLRRTGDTNKPAKGSNSYSGRESRTSAVRRLGTLKTQRSRTVHEISKCDAVDLMEPNTVALDSSQSWRSSGTRPGWPVRDAAQAILDDSRKMIPSTHTEHGRPKSLPGAFPAKTKKFNRIKSSPPGKPHVYKNKNPIASSVSRDTPQSMYSRMMTLPGGFGFESLAIGNGVNQEPDVFSPLSHDSNRSSCNPRLSFTGLAASQRHARRHGTPRALTATSFSGSEGGAWSAATSRDRESSVAPHDVASHLQEAIESAMGRGYRVNEEEEDDSENKENEDNANVKTATKSENSSSDNEDTSNRTHRKVQFNSRETSTSSDESFAKTNVTGGGGCGGGSIIQMPVSVFRSYSPAVQPMSAGELLRFKQRIFPANLPQSTGNSADSRRWVEAGEAGPMSTQRRMVSGPVYFSTSSMMNIKQIYHKSAIPQTPGHETTDTEQEGDEHREHRENLPRSDDEDTDNAVVCHGEYSEDIGDDSLGSNEGEADKPDYYKLIKAIDAHTYSGFEHKKLRRVADVGPRKGESKQKEHYVKVKLR